MKNLPAYRHDRSGMALAIALTMVFILSGIIAVLYNVTGSHMKMTSMTLDSEKAFFVAEAGVERAAQFLANGSNAPNSFVGSAGEGSYVAVIVSGSSITDSWHSIGGQIDINPNSSSAHEFTMTLGDGSQITKAMLTSNYPGIMCNPTMIHVKPMGGGSQNGLMVDGTAYTLNNNNGYDIISDYMGASVYNDSVNTNGKAVGKWWVSVAAAEADLVVNGMGSGKGNIGQAQVQYSIISVGTVRGRAKIILRETIRQKTWADYAMWMNNNNGIYFKSDEKFYGKVHSNEKVEFNGNPEFFDTCTTAADYFDGSTNQCIFHKGFTMGVSNQTIQTISFTNLYAKATLPLEGKTYITFSGSNMLVSNERKGWSKKSVGCSTNKLVYIKNSTSGDSDTRKGDCYLGGTLDGRITVVCDRDAYITNHLYYASDSKTNMLSDDALGIIVKQDIMVTTRAPNNLKIYAHMIATGQYDTSTDTDGSFYVIDHDEDDPRGELMIHGGLVQDDRGAVGKFNKDTGVTTHGYYKNYTYDARFKIDPPPEYPPLSDQLVFGAWKER